MQSSSVTVYSAGMTLFGEAPFPLRCTMHVTALDLNEASGLGFRVNASEFVELGCFC